MASTARTDAQRAASRRNGARSTGPRTTEGRVRSSVNRTTHGLNSVRLLLPTEDVAEYQQHVDEWIESLSPGTPAERQIVLLIGDLTWRLRRIGRIEERRALALLDDHVEKTPEWRTRAKAQELVTVLDTLGSLVNTSAIPVPSAALAGFLGGVRGVMQMLDGLRELLPVSAWPEAEVCAFLLAEKNLARDADAEEHVTTTFTAVGAAATALASALRAVDVRLEAAVQKAREAASTTELLADDEDRRFERHRRLLDTAVSRQLDLLTKLKTLPRPVELSGSFERPPRVELRVVTK
jgi:hypothetical protein